MRRRSRPPAEARRARRPGAPDGRASCASSESARVRERAGELDDSITEGLALNFHLFPLLLQTPPTPCTSCAVSNSASLETTWSGHGSNRKSCDALSTSPQAGRLTRSQSLWTLWATPSAESWSASSLGFELGRFVGSAYLPPALGVACGGPAPRRGWPLVHVQWGVAPRAPVQGR